MSAKNTPAPARKPQKRFELLPTLLIAGLLVLAVIGMTWYVGYRLSEAEQTLIPVSVLAMVAGVLFPTFPTQKSDKTIFFMGWKTLQRVKSWPIWV